MRSHFRPLLAVFSAAALASCTDVFQGTSPRESRASLSIAPRFSPAAASMRATFAEAGLEYNRVRIVIVRPQNDTLKDTTIAFTPTTPDVTLELSVAAVPSEELTAALQFRQVSNTEDKPVFSGTATVKALSLTAGGSIAPIEVEVSYSGEGFTATSVSINPGAGTYNSNGTTQFNAVARDASNTAVTTPIFWSVSDDTKATISSAGLLTPMVTRGSVQVTATAANGISKTIDVELAPLGVGLRVVQGAAQSGAPGSVLPLPVIVELVGPDGLPAAGAGQTVQFSAAGSAQITPGTATLDANGRAQAMMTVGTTPGTTYIYTATVAGITPLTWGGSATVGTPTHFVPSGSTTIELEAGVVPASIPTLRVADDLENSVPGVTLKVTIQKSGVVVFPPFNVPADSIGLLEVYKVAPDSVGTYTVLVESVGITPAIPSITYTVTIKPGPAAQLYFLQQPSGIASGQTMTPAIKVAIQDQFGNTVTSASGTINLAVDPDGETGWSLGGVGSVSAVNGIAVFSNLQVFTSSGAKSGVKIRAVGAGLPAVLSAGFNITP